MGRHSTIQHAFFLACIVQITISMAAAYHIGANLQGDDISDELASLGANSGLLLPSGGGYSKRSGTMDFMGMRVSYPQYWGSNRSRRKSSKWTRSSDTWRESTSRRTWPRTRIGSNSWACMTQWKKCFRKTILPLSPLQIPSQFKTNKLIEPVNLTVLLLGNRVQENTHPFSTWKILGPSPLFKIQSSRYQQMNHEESYCKFYIVNGMDFLNHIPCS